LIFIKVRFLKKVKPRPEKQGRGFGKKAKTYKIVAGQTKYFQ
jgi:hypothetical protein